MLANKMVMGLLTSLQVGGCSRSPTYTLKHSPFPGQPCLTILSLGTRHKPKPYLRGWWSLWITQIWMQTLRSWSYLNQKSQILYLPLLGGILPMSNENLGSCTGHYLPAKYCTIRNRKYVIIKSQFNDQLK